MGGRQVGKSTLVRNSSALGQHLHLTLDTVELRAQALDDPEALAGRAPSLIPDEVQRVLDPLLANQAKVDDEPRRPGRFVLKGSADVLAMKRVKETLAGRASLRHPLASHPAGAARPGHSRLLERAGEHARRGVARRPVQPARDTAPARGSVEDVRARLLPRALRPIQ